MIQILLDETLRARLHGLREPLELCEPNGTVVGRMFPTIEPTNLQSWEPALNLAELQQRAASSEPRLTTTEMLARLENL